MTETRTALITGVSGQDGSYLAEFLLKKGYNVHGLVRRTSTPRPIIDGVHPVIGDLTDSPSLALAISSIKPDEIYNLAAMSYVGSSWTNPVSTLDINTCGVIRLLEAVRQHRKDARVYQASSSEMFGNSNTPSQNEDTPFRPRSPYGVSKVAAHHAIVNYRESYDMFCCSGICFNHESPRRGIEFVTRKITDAVARVHYGLQDEVRLGNINARRDWGYAGDYVEAMWLMLQADEPDDYVVSTGITHSVYDFYDKACHFAGIRPDKYLVCDSDLIRPAEVNFLCGDASKIERELGWFPKTGFDQLVGMMVHADMLKVMNGG